MISTETRFLANNLKSMAEVLNLSTDYLVGLANEPRGQVQGDRLSDDEENLVQWYRRYGEAGVAKWLADKLMK